MWEFFDGNVSSGLVSTDFHCTIGGQLATPMKNERNQYLWNEVWSPDIPLTGAGAVFELQFDVYRDLSRVNRMYYIWHVRSVVAGCPGLWKDANYVYYGDQKDWLTGAAAAYDASPYIVGAATDLNIAVGAIDMCPYWCSPATPGSCHTHSPLIDNVILRRINQVGPQWIARDLDFFNDSWAWDGTLTGTAHADIANDIATLGQTHIDPGDSASIAVNDPINGLDAAPVLYVAVWPANQAGKSGPEIASYDQTGFDFDTLGVPAFTADRYPLIDSLVDGAGTTWYCFQMDSAFTDGYERTGWQPDRYCVDLNDNVFVPGDTICFYFEANSTVSGGTKTWYTRATGGTTNEALVQANPAEFTILPAGGVAAGGDILYVDGMDGRGAQPYFETAFQSMGILHQVDRYDVNNPSSGLANRPGARVFNIADQLTAVYRKIIWNTGNLSAGALGDGDTSQGAEKSDDAFMLYEFLDKLPGPGGVYFSGDDLAELMPTLINKVPDLINDFIPYTLTSPDYFNHSSGTTAPLSVGRVGGCFDHISGADSHVAYGGCAGINDFDVMTPAPLSGTTSEMTYEGSALVSESSVIAKSTVNSSSQVVGVILQGYSFHYIRDASATGLAARFHHLDDVLAWLGNPEPVATGASKPAGKYALSQNYPNPFNPTTTIDYSLKATGHVSLNIYNVAGQLVRSLVDDTKAAGSFKIEWNGRDNVGQAVSSGVYFYKLISNDFSMTKKMVLLK
jgi:hypothetical protein